MYSSSRSREPIIMQGSGAEFMNSSSVKSICCTVDIFIAFNIINKIHSPYLVSSVHIYPPHSQEASLKRLFCSILTRSFWLLIMLMPHAGIAGQTIVAAVDEDIIADYQLFIGARDPLQIDYYGGVGAR